MTLTEQQKTAIIYAVINVDCEDDGQQVKCRFCKQQDIFTGDIKHTSECAYHIAVRLLHIKVWNSFDELAFKVLLRHVADFDGYYRCHHPGDHRIWKLCCFCCEFPAPGVFQSGPLHKPDCAQVLARQALEKEVKHAAS